jgi:hypothetical protein
MRLSIKLGGLVLLSVLLTGCVTTTPYDYTAFRASNPRSILVLLPVNQTLDVSASYSFFTRVTADATLVEQVINSTTDRSYQIAGLTSGRLLSSGAVNGVLPGPRLRSQQRQ